jgi:ribose transport system ATP-binding protein
VAEVLFGIRRPASGEVWLAGKPVDVRSPRGAIAAGVCLVPEDRRSQGLILTDSVKHNTSLASLDRVSRCGLIQPGRERRLAEEMVQRLNIRTAGVDKTVGLLSGGNQQKVVLGKWLCRGPRLLILDEPTRGVDVGAKAEIYALMDRLTAEGMGILMISSDLEEILGMSDRVVVMHEGRLAGELRRSALSEEAVMHLATGGEANR